MVTLPVDPIIVDQSSADPTRMGKSPQKSNGQEIDEDDREVHKIYHFYNCGVVNVDSLNTRTITMENCGNYVPQVTCSSLFSLIFVLIMLYYQITGLLPASKAI
jgi:hypothetical protein